MSTTLPSAFVGAGVPTNLDANSMANALQTAKERAPETGTGLNYIRFLYKDGMFTLGAEEAEIALRDDHFLIHPASFRNQLMLAEGREVLDTVYSPVFSASGELPVASREARGKEEWRRGYAAVMAGLTGDFWMKPAEFSTTSMGGNKAFKNLIDLWIPQLQAEASKPQEDQQTMPIVSFDTESYYSKKAGDDIYNPILVVEGWISSNESIALAQSGEYTAGAQKKALPKRKAAPARKKAPAKKTSRSRK